MAEKGQDAKGVANQSADPTTEEEAGNPTAELATCIKSTCDSSNKEIRRRDLNGKEFYELIHYRGKDDLGFTHIDSCMVPVESVQPHLKEKLEKVVRDEE